MTRTRAFLAALAVTFGAACSNSTGTDTGRLTLKLTDAPGDFKKAVVTIDQIYLQSSSGTNGRLVLRDDDVTVDLLTLANATADLVSDAVIPAGTYAQLHFVITGAYIEVENANGTTSVYASSPTYAGLPAGTQVTGSLQLPSYAQTGIKVNLPGGSLQVTGEQKVLLVDFDVSRSFGQQGGASRQWIMTPVLDATEFALTGGILATLTKSSGVTMPTVNGSQVTLGQFSAVLSNSAGSAEKQLLTDANDDGVFEANFKFIAPGTYALDFEAPSGVNSFTTNPSRPASVTVTSGQQATQAFTLTAIQ